MRRAPLFALLVIGCSRTPASFPCASALIGMGTRAHLVTASFGTVCEPMQPEGVKTFRVEGVLECRAGKWVAHEGDREVILEQGDGECKRLRSGACRISVHDRDGTWTSMSGRCFLLD